MTRRARTALSVLATVIAGFCAAYTLALLAPAVRSQVTAAVLNFVNGNQRAFVNAWNEAVAGLFPQFAFAQYLDWAPSTALYVSAFPSVLGLLAFFVAIRLSKDPPGIEVGDATHGSARWAIPAELASLKKPGGLLLGRDQDRGVVRYTGEQHLVVIGPTRSGKGQGFLVPNLLAQEQADRSMVIVDPKGENAQLTMWQRANYGPVHVLDPFGIVPGNSAAFNPLAGLHIDDRLIVDEVQALAAALVAERQGETPHWVIEARSLLTTYILHVLASAPQEQQHFATVYDWLCAGPVDRDRHHEEMAASEYADGAVKRGINRFLAKADKEASSVMSTAIQSLGWLESQSMRNAVSRSDFDFANLKASTHTVYLVLPQQYLESHAPWQRLLLTRALSSFAAAEGRRRVLFCLDEFPTLGRLERVEKGFGLLAGYGVQMAIIIQDISQLRSLYRETASTFIANAGVTLVMGCPDLPTAEFVSKSLGKATVQYLSVSTSHNGQIIGGRTHSRSDQRVSRELMTPDELRTLDPNVAIALIAGLRPAWLSKIVAWRDPEFKKILKNVL